MALIAARLNQECHGGDSEAIGIVSLSPPLSWDFGPRQYLFGDKAALNQFNQTSRNGWDDKLNKSKSDY